MGRDGLDGVHQQQGNLSLLSSGGTGVLFFVSLCLQETSEARFVLCVSFYSHLGARDGTQVTDQLKY